MILGPLANLATSVFDSLIVNPLTGSSSGTSTSNTATTSGATTSTATSDSNQLSPFAQIFASLQQLQQTNPTLYSQVAQQISNNLQTGAQNATASGNTALASQLTQLSTDFKNASTTGQLPNAQDLAQAVGGSGHHHRHHHAGSTSIPPASSTDTSTTSTTATSGLSQLLQSLGAAQSGTSTSASTNAQSIIFSSLQSAGVPIV